MKPENTSYQFPPAQNGPEEMEGLVLAVRERLHPFVASAVRDRDVAEDVLQDVAVVLIEQGHRLRRSDCFWPWVYRIAWSKVQDHFRDSRRARRFAAEIERQGGYPWMTAGDASEAAIRRDLIERLARAVEQLNARCRVILFLRFHERMPYDKIASVMHSTPGQVRIQFHRAKRLLRDSLLSSCA